MLTMSTLKEKRRRCRRSRFVRGLLLLPAVWLASDYQAHESLLV
jgi:hypothetical protein